MVLTRTSGQLQILLPYSVLSSRMDFTASFKFSHLFQQISAIGFLPSFGESKALAECIKVSFTLF